MGFSQSLDEAAMACQSVIEKIEDFSLHLPTIHTLLKLLAAGVPLSIILDGVFNDWYTHVYSIPGVSTLARWWRSDMQIKQEHVKLLRNLACLGLATAAIDSSAKSKQTTSDYVIDRVMSTTAQKSVKTASQASQRAAYEAAHELMVNTGIEETQISHQLDAELRRRATKEMFKE